MLKKRKEPMIGSLSERTFCEGNPGCRSPMPPIWAGYCAPTPEVRLLHSLQTQAAEARKLLG
jgi:hypothetical protein